MTSNIYSAFSQAGTLDPSFDSDGIVTTPIGIVWEAACAVLVQPDGKIIAAGYSNSGSATQNEVVIFPNPASSELVVSSSEFGEIEMIEIYSSLGEKVLSQLQTTNHKQQTIDISQLPSCIYFITVTDQAGNKVTKKIVKM